MVNQMKMILIKFFCFVAFLSSSCPQTAGAAEKVYHIQLNDASINPVTAEYISRSIDQATKENAQCLILEMDTPGGLLNSTRTIVKKILGSEIPVVVYIAPSGSRAGSAGVFITYASHLAAMAPSTNIGAAHPVSIGGGVRKSKSPVADKSKEEKKEEKKE